MLLLARRKLLRPGGPQLPRLQRDVGREACRCCGRQCDGGPGGSDRVHC
jgi:hypothetical protein